MQRGWIAVALVTLTLAARLTAWGEPVVVDLYPGEKLASEVLGEEQVTERGTEGQHNRSVTHVTRPTITVYVAPADKATGAAVIICPGGGYGGLAIDKEGHDVAEWLNSLGVTGCVLKYRMPDAAMMKPGESPWPLQDAQRAIKTVRDRAGEWKVDPKRVGVIGFSAGGHLASSVSTHYDAPTRPDFAILVYPVIFMKGPYVHVGSRNNLLGKEPSAELVDEYSNDLHVNGQTPPTLLVHAEDDGVKCENSLAYFQALRAAKVPAELLLYVKGGHGFGLAKGKGDVSMWPARCVDWLVERKIAVK